MKKQQKDLILVNSLVCPRVPELGVVETSAGVVGVSFCNSFMSCLQQNKTESYSKAKWYKVEP